MNTLSVKTNILPEMVAPLLTWYGQQKRDLPWRDTGSAYHVWISEIMLQQTRVEAVKPYFERFLEKFPDISALAAAPEDVLLKAWEGLGYYTRARNLQKAAKIIETSFQGKLPEEVSELLTLPGIGRYTAGAIASIAYGKKAPAVDGNVLRILMRLLACPEDISRDSVKKQTETLLAPILPENAGDFNQALMDLGAMVCLPKKAARCPLCPLKKLCLAGAEGTFASYPQKAEKKPRRLEKKTILLLTCKEQILVRKRPGSGLLAGLWEFPQLEGHASKQELTDVLQQKGCNCKDTSIRKLSDSKHLFTHIEWQMTGYEIELPSTETLLFPEEDCQWVHKQELRTVYAVPSAFRIYTAEATD